MLPHVTQPLFIYLFIYLFFHSTLLPMRSQADVAQLQELE
jgi:hypothetical protein